MEAVEIVESHEVDKLFHLVDGVEMARHVEQCAAVAKAGCILHDDGGQFHGARLAGRKSLAQSLNAIEDAGWRTADRDAVGIHFQPIAFGRL